MQKKELYGLLRDYFGHGPCHNDKLKSGRNLKWSAMYGHEARAAAEGVKKVLEDAGVKDVTVSSVDGGHDCWSKTVVHVPQHYFA